MSRRIENLPPALKAKVEAALERESTKKPKRGKYGNERTEEGFDSLHERRIYNQLVQQYGASSVICQVSFPLAYGPKSSERIKPDFLVIQEVFEDGSFRGFFADAKGHETAAWKRKANALMRLFRIGIRRIYR